MTNKTKKAAPQRSSTEGGKEIKAYNSTSHCSGWGKECQPKKIDIVFSFVRAAGWEIVQVTENKRPLNYVVAVDRTKRKALVNSTCGYADQAFGLLSLVLKSSGQLAPDYILKGQKLSHESAVQACRFLSVLKALEVMA